MPTLSTGGVDVIDAASLQRIKNDPHHSYSLPDLKLVGSAELGGKGAGWVTLTPDGKTAYVAM